MKSYIAVTVLRKLLLLVLLKLLSDVYILKSVIYAKTLTVSPLFDLPPFSLVQSKHTSQLANLPN